MQLLPHGLMYEGAIKIKQKVILLRMQKSRTLLEHMSSDCKKLAHENNHRPYCSHVPEDTKDYVVVNRSSVYWQFSTNL